MKRFIQSEIRINAAKEEILNAFLDPLHLANWWGVNKAYVEKKDGGLYTLAWMPTGQGYKFVSTGQINTYSKRSHLHLEKMLYLNYERPILGPFTIQYNVEERDGYNILSVKQNGFSKEPHNEWLYENSKDGWAQALILVKNYLEK